MEKDEHQKLSEKKNGVEPAVFEKVGAVASAASGAKNVDEVISALHSLAVLFFPLDSHALSGSIDKRYREEVIGAKIPSAIERDSWRKAFYKGAAFPTLARVLLYNVASDWLACFPITARKLVYDVFFVGGPATEVVHTLVPCLQLTGGVQVNASPICTNAERLIVLCLLENDGFLQMAREFMSSCQFGDLRKELIKPTICRVAQLVTSIPDKVRLGGPKSLSSHLLFKNLIIQLLAGAEEWDRSLVDDATVFSNCDADGTILFVGEVFARICRRGSADVLLSEVLPRILRDVQTLTTGEAFVSSPGCRFWLKLLEAIKDPYALERMAEQLLHQLAAKDATDTEAYWILWIMFHRVYEHQTTIRSMFVEKFLLWKVFPICCLKWILQFAVLQCPPHTCSTKDQNIHGLLDMVQRLLAVWSDRKFVQSAQMEQQAYITAAIGLSLEKMSREDLDATKGAMHLILQGVSCRLESPSHLVRKMASNIALVFSKVIDPKNPLYLDDNCHEEPIDWEFGLKTSKKGALSASNCVKNDTKTADGCTTWEPKMQANKNADDEMGNDMKGQRSSASEFKLVDPDEIIDPAMLNNVSFSDEDSDGDGSDDSETSTDSSLQPYDLADDDTDLKRKFSQLVDVVGALRKSDDADGVERALDIAEKLVRASPDELKYVASELVRTLVHLRCSDHSIEGEEESAEDKRQKALVALVVTSPPESLDALNKILYSSTVDTSQRLLILDVMTDAAQELSDSKTIQPKHQARALVSINSDTQPWFMPSSIGPPGAGSWKEISGTGMLLNVSHSYERELPLTPGQIKRGKTRRWSSRSSNVHEHHMEYSQNKFPPYAAAFMLPAMQGFDKKRHGVDLLGRDFIILGKLIYMLGICMKCAAMHPEASALALPLMDMLSSREICQHVEAYVRRSVLFAASCLLVSIHPSYIASALSEGNTEILRGLEWIRTWALKTAESDVDRECYTMAMTCLQLHAEMALQASRAQEAIESTLKARNVILPSNLSYK